MPGQGGRGFQPTRSASDQRCPTQPDPELRQMLAEWSCQLSQASQMSQLSQVSQATCLMSRWGIP